MSIMLIATSFRVYYSYASHNLIASPLISLLIALSLNHLYSKHASRGLAVIAIMLLLLFSHGYPYVKKHLQVGNKFYFTVKKLGREITRLTQPKDLIISFNHFLLLESGRYAVPEVTFSTLSINPRYTDEKSKKLRVVNHNLLMELIQSKKAKMIEISDRRSLYLRYKILGSKWYQKINQAMLSNYIKVYSYPDIHYSGENYYLYLRRE